MLRYLCLLAVMAIGCTRAPITVDMPASFIGCPQCIDCHEAKKTPMPVVDGGLEYHSDAAPAPVNQRALQEPKLENPQSSSPRIQAHTIQYRIRTPAWQPCPCQPCQPGQPCQPQGPGEFVPPAPRADPPVNRLTEVKTGTYACQKCKRPTVGIQWHQTYTRDGASALFLCERCWQASTVSERRFYLESYLERHAIAPEKRESYRQAVR